MPDRSTHRDQVEVREMEKWSGLWRTREYRSKECPAGPIVQAAIRSLGIRETDTIIDFGCGRGAALTVFAEEGYGNVTGLDIASNALDEHLAAHYPLVRACLWNLPGCLHADYGYCADVMEDIPKEKVNLALQGIKSATKLGCFFQMSDTDPLLWDDHLSEVWPTVVSILSLGHTRNQTTWFSVIG